MEFSQLIERRCSVRAFKPLGYAAEEGAGRLRIVPDYTSLVMYENGEVKKKESEHTVAVKEPKKNN
ncbi:hypothetical protein ACFL4W_00445 [Planctomycetota bacterium]